MWKNNGEYNMEPLLIILIVVLALLLAILLLVPFLIYPGKRREGVREFSNVLFAHRGLHDERHAENSLSAFARAVEHGYGIELDVRLSEDGTLVVFHDDTLDRVAGVSGRVRDFSAEALARMSLSGTGEGIPTFREVLDLVDGRVPLLVEIKEDAGDSAVSEKTAEMLASYHGPFVIESFNPLSLARIRHLLPEVYRGQLSDRFTREKQYRKPMYALLEMFLLNFRARPDFIAYRFDEVRFFPLRLLRALFPRPMFAYTVKSEEEEHFSRAHGFDTVIFEQYLPKKETEDKPASDKDSL